jgi:hypothetical protein
MVESDPASVFDFVFDSSKRSMWQHDVQRSSTTIPDPVEGSSWVEVRKIGSRELRVTVTVTEVSRPSFIRFIGDAGPFGGEGAFEFRRIEDRTEVSYYADIQGRGWNSLFTGLVARKAQRISQANLYRLTLCFPEHVVPADPTPERQSAIA